MATASDKPKVRYKTNWCSRCNGKGYIHAAGAYNIYPCPHCNGVGPRLTPDVLTEQYGHLLRITDTMLVPNILHYSNDGFCDSCAKEFAHGEAGRRIYLDTVNVRFAVCRDYAACERRRAKRE